MLKSLQTKIVVAFCITGLIVISALSATYIYNLTNIRNELNKSEDELYLQVYKIYKVYTNINYYEMHNYTKNQ